MVWVDLPGVDGSEALLRSSTLVSLLAKLMDGDFRSSIGESLNFLAGGEEADEDVLVLSFDCLRNEKKPS